MKATPKQIAILVLAVISLAFAAWYLFIRDSGDVKLPHSHTMIDVTTGQLYQVSTRTRSMMEPGKNPETGNSTLVTVVQEDGKWIVRARSRPYLTNIGADPSIVNIETGEVLKHSGTPKQLDV